MELLLIRHTTPDVASGICYGQTDLNVNGTFDKESKEIKNIIADLKPEHVYSSPLIRCHQLAKELFPYQPIQTDDRLMEMNFGKWEGLKWSEIPKNELDTWANDFINLAPPLGESFAAFMNRITVFEEEVLNKLTQEKIALITHSGVIRSFLMKYLAIPEDKIFNLHLNYGAVIKIDIHSEQYSQVKILKG